MEILRIARSVEEITDVFRELASLSIDHENSLDIIEFEMEKSVTTIVCFCNCPGTCSSHPRERNPFPARCIILLIILISIFLVVLIVKNSVKSSAK